MTRETKYEEHQDSPWYTGASLPHIDRGTGPIRIVPLKQGFLVKRRCVAERAFTDRVDAAEWLLSWLGFEDEIVESVRDILAGLWDADELYDILPDCVAGVDYDELGDRDCAVAHVALAAWAYTEVQGFDAQEKQYQKLVEAVKKWRIDDPEQRSPPMPSRALDVAGWAWLYIESGHELDFVRLVEAVKKWRASQGEEIDPDYIVHRRFFEFDTMTRADHELMMRHKGAIDVAEAAQAYTELRGLDAQRAQYLKLVEAVGKWRGMGNEDPSVTDTLGLGQQEAEMG